MGAVGKELLKAFRRSRNRIGPCDPGDVESLLARRSRQRRFEACGFAQKSRLA
jgi:hypothetical protein